MRKFTFNFCSLQWFRPTSYFLNKFRLSSLQYSLRGLMNQGQKACNFPLGPGEPHVVKFLLLPNNEWTDESWKKLQDCLSHINAALTLQSSFTGRVFNISDIDVVQYVNRTYRHKFIQTDCRFNTYHKPIKIHELSQLKALTQARSDWTVKSAPGWFISIRMSFLLPNVQRSRKSLKSTFQL